MPRNLARITLPLAGVWFLFAAYWFFFREGATLGGFIFIAAGCWMLYRGFRARRRAPEGAARRGPPPQS